MHCTTLGGTVHMLAILDLFIASDIFPTDGRKVS